MEILEQAFYGNSVLDWLIAGSVALAATGLFRLVQYLIRTRLSRLAKKTDTPWDDHLVNVISSTKLLFWLIFGVFIGSQWLDLPDKIQWLLRTVFMVSLLLQAGLWGGELVSSALDEVRKRKQDKNPEDLTTLGLISLAGRVAVWSVVVLLILDNLGVDITALIAGLGIGGVAVALALQNILGDLFASLSIVLDKPFVVGDFLAVGDMLGSVEKVGLKTTRLRSLSGEQLVFSNTDLLSSRVRNYGRMYERRVVFKLGVTYQTPREKLVKIPEIIREAITEQDNARFDRSHFSAYGDFSLNFESVYYVTSPDYAQYMDIQQSIYLKIHERFENEAIEFAYPTQTVFLEQGETAESH